MNERPLMFVADPDPVRGMGTILRTIIPMGGRQNGDAKLLLEVEPKTRKP